MKHLYSMKIKFKTLLLSSEFLLLSQGNEKHAWLHYGDILCFSSSSQLEEASAVSVLCTDDAAYLGEEFDHCCEETKKAHQKGENPDSIFTKALKLKSGLFSSRLSFLPKIS